FKASPPFPVGSAETAVGRRQHREPSAGGAGEEGAAGGKAAVGGMVLDLVVLAEQVDTPLDRGGLEDGRRRRAEVEADAALGAALPAPDRPARLVGVEGQVEDTELGEGGG